MPNIIPSHETQTMIRTLAASLTPTTLAAVIVDLRANDQVNDNMQELADYAERYFTHQLDGLVGRDQADNAIADAEAR